jgi:hypothetical protein
MEYYEVNFCFTKKKAKLAVKARWVAIIKEMVETERRFTP